MECGKEMKRQISQSKMVLGMFRGTVIVVGKRVLRLELPGKTGKKKLRERSKWSFMAVVREEIWVVDVREEGVEDRLRWKHCD